MVRGEGTAQPRRQAPPAKSDLDLQKTADRPEVARRTPQSVTTRESAPGFVVGKTGRPRAGGSDLHVVRPWNFSAGPEGLGQQPPAFT